VLRRGLGLELQLKDDTTLVLTADDAEAGAGLINDLIVTPIVQGLRKQTDYRSASETMYTGSVANGAVEGSQH
jgi:hypothetical protein